jgi:phosphate starvation-inducible PhoH-like protein
MQRYITLLEALKPSIVIVNGRSGTGKTMQACKIGQKMVGAGIYDKIILTRPAVTSEEDHGFIPGTLDDKMKPWIKPCMQYLNSKKTLVEICPLAYMRGLTFDKSWIIADEMQNSTESQMLMLLTRIGYGSKLVIAGDPGQTDDPKFTGLSDLIRRVAPSENIQMVTLNEVKRSPVIEEVLDMYEHLI